MKTILTAAFLILWISSCTKDNINTSRFYGTWEIRFATGFGTSPSQNYEPGNGTYIELKPDGTINRYENAQPTSSETFRIVKKDITACKWSTSHYLAIEYGSGNYDQIRVNNDTLRIPTPPCWQDGGHRNLCKNEPVVSIHSRLRLLNVYLAAERKFKSGWINLSKLSIWGR